MEKKQQEDIDDWYKVMLYRLIDVCKIVSSKYTRAKVRKALPVDYGYIIEELITEKPEVLDKEHTTRRSSRLSSKSEAPRTSSLPWQS